MDNRRLVRMNFDMSVELIQDTRSIKGKAQNLSIGGVFVLTNEKLDLNSKVNIHFSFGGECNKLSLKMEGIVTRIEGNGIAIKFTDKDGINNLISRAFNK